MASAFAAVTGVKAISTAAAATSAETHASIHVYIEASVSIIYKQQKLIIKRYSYTLRYFKKTEYIYFFIANLVFRQPLNKHIQF